MSIDNSWAALLRGRNGLRSIALAGGVALHAINVYLVTTILPSVVADIGGLSYYAWNMTLFVMASIIGSALSPKLLQSVGLRHAFVVAMLVFTVGTIACALAFSMPAMLVGRTIQGLGGGFLLGLCYSAVRIVFPEVLWPRAMVLVSSMWGVSTLIGPTIGGVFAESGHWRLAFWSVIPVIVLLLLLVYTQIEAGKPDDSKKLKVPMGKLLILAVSVLCVSWASLSVNWLVNASGIVLAVLLSLFTARLDRHSEANLLPRGTYQWGGTLAVLYGCIALLSLAITVEVFIPYFLQTIHYQSPLVAGYFMASLSFAWTVGSFLSAGRSATTTHRYVQYGPFVSGAGLVGLAIMMPMNLSSSASAMAMLLLPLMAVGGGIGVCWPHVLTRVYQAAPKGQENIASSAIITVQLYALALGGAFAGMLTNLAGFVEPGGFEGARQASVVLFSVLSIGPLLTVYLIYKGLRKA